jgi:hypothetical protein
MSCSLFEKSLYSFDMTILIYIFVQCVEYNNDEQPRLLISVIQNLISQILPLYLDVDLR